MSWQTDISKAPKSYEIAEKILNPDGTQKFSKPKDGEPKPLTRTNLIKRYIWAACSDGSCGTSYWIPAKNRWCGFVEGQDPVAFIELPEHYHIITWQPLPEPPNKAGA